MPNVLLITSDQQHWNTLGRHLPEIRTPNLDRLAAQGIDCRRAYCPNPTCTPSRASILTGQYPSAHGAWSLGTKLPENVPTVSGLFSQAGYRTGLIGKAHLQPLASTKAYLSIECHPTVRDLEFWRGFHGPFYGFDHVELARNHGDEAHVGQHYALWMEEKGAVDWRRHFQSRLGRHDYSEGGTPHPPQRGAWSLPEPLHMNAWITERSGDFLRESRREGRPFFLWASYFDPHPPYLVPDPWASMYDPDEITLPVLTHGEHDRNPPHFGLTQTANPDFSAYQETPFANHGFSSHLMDPAELRKDIATYYGMVSMLDHSVGKLLDDLEEQGLADDTLVVFTSDHGHYYGHHGLTKKGAFHYEDGIRVPLLARWPGRIPAGQESGALVSLVDLPITFLRAAGLTPDPGMIGRDAGPAWSGEAEAIRDDLLVEFRHQPNTIHLRTLVSQRYKITIYRGQPYGELFDLEQDPGETHNLWDDLAAVSLKTGLIRRMLDASMEAEPLWMPRVAGA